MTEEFVYCVDCNTILEPLDRNDSTFFFHPGELPECREDAPWMSHQTGYDARTLIDNTRFRNYPSGDSFSWTDRTCMTTLDDAPTNWVAW